MLIISAIQGSSLDPRCVEQSVLVLSARRITWNHNNRSHFKLNNLFAVCRMLLYLSPSFINLLTHSLTYFSLLQNLILYFLTTFSLVNILSFHVIAFIVFIWNKKQFFSVILLLHSNEILLLLISSSPLGREGH